MSFRRSIPTDSQGNNGPPLLDLVMSMEVFEKNRIIREKLQKTLDKGRTLVLDLLTLIQDLVHFLEAIHNIWMSADAVFLFSRRVFRGNRTN